MILCVCVVINNFSDPHNQCFLRGHKQLISCMDMSETGTLVASGEQGTESDVIVWDYETKELKYRFEEHLNGIDAVRFSKDEVSVADGQYAIT